MQYIFRLELKKDTSKLILLKDDTAVDERSWPEARDMGTKLFQAMAEMLKEQGLKPADIADFVVESDLPDVYTSTRIAETVKKVYAFGVRLK
ncbi:MAG: hypothetical protein KBA91_02465 [Candidatus Moranbacteria bacterium]|jgi:tRNA A37 threonylcarbamoyladenosine modification protein TsaB|nr:hypothetical protein [Candidatus Moranbacteria bacterium]